MNRRTILALLAVAFPTGCSNPEDVSTGERFQSEGESFSCTMPSGWSAERDRGAVIFTPTADSKRTIAIRAVPRRAENARKALDATDVVMRALPEVQIASKRSIAGKMQGTRYQLSFQPPETSGRYTRTHIVLVGEGHIFHVIETSPWSNQVHDDAVSNVAASLREDV